MRDGVTIHPDDPTDDRHADATQALAQYASGRIGASQIEAREVLPAKVQRVIAITALLAREQKREFEAAVQSAVRDGVTPSELLEMLRLISHYGVRVPQWAIEDVRNACGEETG